MTTIVEFLTARLDEDQAIATAAKWKHWVPGSGLHPASVETAEPQAGWHGECATVANLMATVGKVQRERQHAVHIAHHDPARVLREVEAKRAIVEQWRQAAEEHRRDDCDEGVGASWATLCFALVTLAGVWSSHADYAGSSVDDWTWPDDDPAWTIAT